MNRILAVFLFLVLLTTRAEAQDYEKFKADSTFIQAVQNTSLSKYRKKELIKDYLKGKIEDLNDIDTAWISPNYYNYAFMIQNTNTFDNFSITGDGTGYVNYLEFAPAPTFRLGGYFGWRWLFLGYTFDIKDLLGSKRENEKRNTEVGFSLYTSKIGIDLYYRKTGNNFKIRNTSDLAPVTGQDFDNHFNGLNIYMKGINLYYVFNHRRFSLPAAFSQSTEQRRSCGSFKLGLSYSVHKIDFDHKLLPEPIRMNISDAMKFDMVHYSDYNISFGYAYNWVFKRDWLLDFSFTPALAYTHSHLERDDSFNLIEDLRFKNLNVDFISRLGLVYNNAKYFAGLSIIAHSFNYKKKEFSVNNSFGSVNFYVGLNFLRKKKYRNM